MMRPWPCCVSAGRSRGERRGGPGEVDRHHAGDPVRVRFVLLLVPQLPDGDDDQVDRLAGGLEAADDGLVGVVGLRGVEEHRLDVGHGAPQFLCRMLERDTVPSRPGRPTGNGLRPAAPGARGRCPRSRRGRRPIAGDRRRRSSCDAEPAGEVGGEHAFGIHPPADRHHVGQPGVHDRQQLRPQAGVLGQVDAAACPGDEVVEVGRGVPAGPGGPSGKSSAKVHPSWLKESGPGVPGPNRFKTARNEGIPDDAMAATASSTTSPRWGATANWYCTNPSGPYSRFQRPTPSSGWKKPARGRSEPSGRRGDPEPGLVQRTDGHPVDEPTGSRSGHTEPRIARDLTAAPTQPVRERSGGGVVAPREDRPMVAVRWPRQSSHATL